SPERRPHGHHDEEPAYRVERRRGRERDDRRDRLARQVPDEEREEEQAADEPEGVGPEALASILVTDALDVVLHVRPDLGDAEAPARRILLEEAQREQLERGRRARIELRGTPRRLAEEARDDVHRVVRVERDASAEDLVEDHAERVDVRALV